MSLLEVSRRLKNQTIDKAVAPFTEARAGIRRVILMALATVWVVHWRGVTSNQVLSQEAADVLPFVLTFLVFSIIWAVVVRRPALRGKEWPDAVGTVADFAGIAVLMSVAFNLLLPFVIFLPLTAITVGARYSQRAFWVGIAGALVVVGFSAPEGYWNSRPVVGVLAIALLVGIPMTVNRLLTSLREISEEAIHARDTQTRFLAMMSHELRTPLNSIVNAAGLVDGKRMPDDQVPLLDIVKTNAAVLLSRVDDVLDVAAIDGGTFQLQVVPFELRSTLQTVRNVVQSLLHDKGVELTVSVSNDVPQVLIGDYRRFTQVLCNLTSNAVKYTPRTGKVHIDVGAGASESRHVTELVIAVSDTGIGIPDSQKAKIFEPFHQVSQGESRAHEGVGLGLHIVRTVSDRMGGRLEVTDRPGGGSVFTWRIELPVAGPGLRVTETLEMLDMLQRHRIAAAPRSCLVIDDNPSNLDIMRRILVLGGHQVLTAPSGELGLRLLRSTPIDVAFLDLHMPGMSGWDVLQEHRNGRGGSQATKIVILSAVTDAESRERAFSMGVAGYLRKPMMTAELLDMLVQLGPSGAGAPATAGQQTEASEQNHLDVMRSIASRDDVSAYLEACVEELVETLRSIEVARRDPERSGLFEQVHRLKNVFMNGGFEPEAEMCSRVMASVREGADTVNAEIDQLALMTERVVSALEREPEYVVSRGATAGA